MKKFKKVPSIVLGVFLVAFVLFVATKGRFNLFVHPFLVILVTFIFSGIRVFLDDRNPPAEGESTEASQKTNKEARDSAKRIERCGLARGAGRIWNDHGRGKSAYVLNVH